MFHQKHELPKGDHFEEADTKLDVLKNRLRILQNNAKDGESLFHEDTKSAGMGVSVLVELFTLNKEIKNQNVTLDEYILEKLQSLNIEMEHISVKFIYKKKNFLLMKNFK